MRVSLQWLRELVACPLPVEELAERLSVAGFEVEEIDDLAARAAGVVVGLVQSREPHPNADKLSVCRVQISDGAEPLQIVCGAQNVRAGIHVAVATVGSVLPAIGLTIKPAELRGVASTGMICSLTELGLTEQSDGIVILDEVLERIPPLGTPVGPLFGLDDQVLELAITANRPDGLSMQGIAREVAALSGAPLHLPPAAPEVSAQPLPIGPEVREAIEAGGLFSLTALDGLTVAPSPLWLQQRLERAGLRPINNVVDITNLVMLEVGQPLHAFDSSRLAALADQHLDPAEIGLRPGRAGEGFAGLDGSQHSIGPEALLVTYADQPIALAGVIGGANACVEATTTSIWLEAAMFAPQAVRCSARSVGLRTDASSRFEKGLPCEVTLLAADRAVQLFQEICGAKLQGRWLHRRPLEPQAPLLLRRDALHNLLGPEQHADGSLMDLADAEIEQILTALGCQLDRRDQGWAVTVPPSRAMDLQREVDLIEEVARLVGYDRFAAHLPDPIGPGGLTPEQQAERRLRRSLVQSGLQECCSLSLAPAESQLLAAQQDGPARIALANPLLADYGHLRDSLVEDLLLAAQRNLQSGQSGFWAFEIGHVFSTTSPSQRQQLQLAGVICGSRQAELWSTGGKAQSPDYFAARGLLQRSLEGLNLPTEDRRCGDNPLLHPGRAAELLVEGRSLGWFGQVHPEQLDALDLPAATFAFQLQMAPLLLAATRRNRWQISFAPYPTVPASERDLALVVPAEVGCGQLLAAIRKAGRPLLEHAALVDRYAGDQVQEGFCSQAFRLRYRDPKRTLTDADVESAHAAIRSALERQFGATLRT
jgi:phenylalanyl-tRNA synthetase beta chain